MVGIAARFRSERVDQNLGGQRIVDRLHDVVHHDWKDSHDLDLTDEALFAELEKHGGKGIEELGIKC